MFERFTERARKVMALANQEALRFQHEYIGTEHILLGLIKEGTGVGAIVLKDLGVDLQAIRDEVEKMVKSGPDTVPMGRLPHTPMAKNVIEQAIIAARGLNHSYVGTEHLLLGLLAVPEGIACKVLVQLGVTPGDARQRVMAIVGEGKAPAPGGGAGESTARYVPLSAACEEVLGHARAEARQRMGLTVEPIHLLLAMVRRNDEAASVLREHGVTYEEILERLSPGKGKPAGEPSPAVEAGAASDLAPAAPGADVPEPPRYSHEDLPDFTDRARKVMALANQEAQRFNHEHIGTEHILLGLIKEGTGVGATVLKILKVDLREVRLEVEKMVKSAPEMVSMGPLPYMPRARNAIKYAREEARDMKHNFVGTEHLLLGLLREGEGVGARVLMNLGLRLEDVREETLCLLGARPPREEPPALPRKRWWQWWR